MSSKLDDKYEGDLFENRDYDYSALEFYLNDLVCSSIDISSDESQNDDVLSGLYLQVED